MNKLILIIFLFGCSAQKEIHVYEVYSNIGAFAFCYDDKETDIFEHKLGDGIFEYTYLKGKDKNLLEEKFDLIAGFYIEKSIKILDFDTSKCGEDYGLEIKHTGFIYLYKYNEKFVFYYN